MTDLKNKICLITGAAQGLGRKTAILLAQEGMDIILADVNLQEARKVAAEISKNKGSAKAFFLDVADEKSVADLKEKLKKEYEKIDVLINNAAIDFTLPITKISQEQWKKVISVNLIGPFLLTKMAFEIMPKGGGNIINICSTASKRAWENASAYHSSKWGLLGFSYASLTEGRKKNIKVTALVSGGMKTPFILDRFPEAESKLQETENVAGAIKFVLGVAKDSMIPEIMIIPIKETSWP